MLISLADYRGCLTDELPPRQGPVVLGLDMGEATSASAVFAIWPATGRCETWMGYGDTPSATARSKLDGARYDLMVSRGELKLYPGRVTPVAEFLGDVAADLKGEQIYRLAGDAYKDAEVKDFLEKAGLNWPYQFRRVGAGKDGGADVRAMQRLFLQRKVSLKENLSFATALQNSAIRRDGNGNPGQDKKTSRGRIDLASACVIACGVAEGLMSRPKQKPRRLRAETV